MRIRPTAACSAIGTRPATAATPRATRLTGTGAARPATGAGGGFVAGLAAGALAAGALAVGPSSSGGASTLAAVPNRISGPSSASPSRTPTPVPTATDPT
jgi:hypothetical protein